MKIKKIGKSMVAIILGAAMCFSALAFTGCKKKKNNSDNEYIDPSNVTINVTADRTELHAGTNEKATISVEIIGLTDQSYTLSVIGMGSGTGVSYVQLDGNVLSLKTDMTPRIDQAVQVVATSTVASTITGSVTIVIRAQVIEGYVGELSTDAFTALGNSSITVSGEVKDIFDDFNNSSNYTERTYDYLVKMSDGKWYGEWNRQGNTAKDITNYRRAADPIKGTDRHTLNQVFINKNNEKAEKAVTDYMSEPFIWEEQHMWNHLALLGTDVTNQWVYDATTEEYIYQIDDSYDSAGNPSDDLFLRTYLAYSLTPMLDSYDTLHDIRLKVTDGVITQMIASTTPYYGEDVLEKDATSVSYTLLTANFTDVGSTTVPEPTPYEADEGTSMLQAALNKMKGATNYTFKALDTTVSGPSYDAGEYETESYSATSKSVKSATRTPIYNTVKNSGDVGVVGWVTDDAVIFEETSKYSATLDGNNTIVKYTGYKQITDSVFDYFEFNSENFAFEGKKQYSGKIHEKKMPQFDFAAEVFEYTGDRRVQTGSGLKYYPEFVLRDPAITRDVAMQVSSHSYARDAKGATYGSFVITLTDSGDLYSVTFPYSLVVGTYLGVIETTFSKIGNTTLPEGWDDEYANRVVRSEWSEFKEVKYYHPTHDTRDPYGEIAADVLFNNIFGNEAKKLPKPSAFTNVFGDNMTECFFEWDDITDDAGVVTGYQEWISFNLSLDLDHEYVDENAKLSLENHEKVIAELTKELAKYGFEYSWGNSTPGGEKWGSRYSTYINGNIMIRIENNKTRFFFVDVFPVGKWTLNND